MPICLVVSFTFQVLLWLTTNHDLTLDHSFTRPVKCRGLVGVRNRSENAHGDRLSDPAVAKIATLMTIGCRDHAVHRNHPCGSRFRVARL